MIAELTKTVSLAKADLDRATATIQLTENRMGSDLGELRSMQDMAASDTPCGAAARKSALNSARTYWPTKPIKSCSPYWRRHKTIPAGLWPRRITCWESYPSLRRLKDGLVDAQLRSSRLLGTMTADHPKVLVAKEAEEEIGRNLHSELAIARRGVEVELRMPASAARSWRINWSRPMLAWPVWPPCARAMPMKRPK